MKPSAFEFSAPGSLEEALDLVGAGDGDTKVLAGGQSLVPLMNLRLAAPERLVDLNGIAGLADVRAGDDGVRIGAMARQRAVELSPEVARVAPLLVEALRHVGHFQTRNRGTVGGIVAHADPAAELGAVLLALDGSLAARSADRGERTIAGADCFRSYFTTALADDEILTELWFPALADGTGWSFAEVARREGDFAIVAVAAVVAVADDEVVDARLAFAGVGATPVRAPGAENVLRGQRLADAVHDASERVREELEPTGDMHGSADYRRHVAAVLTRRCLVEAAERARTGGRGGQA